MQKRAEHYEHIDAMSEEFQDWARKQPPGMEGGTASIVWTLRIQLAIAQQLSVIAGVLKEK